MLQEFKIDVGIATGAEAIGCDNHPGVPICISGNVQQDVIDVGFARSFVDGPPPGVRIVGPFEAARENEITARIAVGVGEMKRSRRVQRNAGPSRSATLR